MKLLRKTGPWILLLLLAAAPSLAGDREEMVPGEDALWRAAGETFSQGGDRAAALQQYRLFLGHYEKSSRAARARFMAAECYFLDGDYASALKEYDRVHKQKGNTHYLEASALLRQGECLYNLGQYDRALALYTELLNKYSDTYLAGEGLFEMGQAQAASLDWRSLEKTYDRLLEDHPGYQDRPQVRFVLGLFAFVRQDYKQAAENFKKVKTDLGLYYLGRCLEADGQYILAIQRYRQAQRMFPDSPLNDDVAFSIAEAFYRSEQYEIARDSYQRFLDAFPKSEYVPMARYKLACVDYATGQYNDSIHKLERLTEDLPDDPVVPAAHYLEGNAWMKLGRTSHAVFAFTEVVRGASDTEMASAALHKIVFAYAADGNYAQAVLMAQQFLDRFPGDRLAARVQLLKGYGHLQLKEFDQAVRDFQNVMDRFVNTEVGERALFLATQTYFQRDQFDRLITNYRFLASRLLPSPSVWRARTYYDLAEAYYAQGLYREASGMYRMVLTGYPRSDVAAASLQGLVASLSQLGEYDVAMQEQEKFLFELRNADSEKSSNSLAIGSIYFNQHKYEEALERFTSFLQDKPDSSEAAVALLYQGDCFYRLQYYENAVDAWGQLVRKYPHASQVEEALYRLADTQFGLGKFDDAIATYQRLGKRFPHGAHAADAAFGLANCYYNLQRDDDAVKAFEAFASAFPDDPRVEDAQTGIQSAYYRSGKDMGQYLQQHGDSPLAADYYWTKGQNAFADKKYEEAAQAFEKVTLDFAGSESAPEALFYLAESYYRMNQLEQALAGYRNFATTHPDHELVGLARFREGTVLYKLKKYEQAASVYEQLADKLPDSKYAPLALYNAALCYQEQEDWPTAVGVLERLLADFPDHERAKGLAYQIGGLYQDELGDYQHALQYYQQALDRHEAGPEELGYLMGQCHEKLGDVPAALTSYELSAAGSDRTDPHRIASLVQIGKLNEDKGDWNTALQAYNRIVASGGKPEWTAMAQGRIQEIQARAAGQ